MPENDRSAQYDVFEVFVQYKPLEHHVHVGSVVAPSPLLALQVARENFLRRDTAYNIWVVKQTDIYATSYEDQDFFANHELNKSYRNVAGYSENAHKWKTFKGGRAMSLDELVSDDDLDHKKEVIFDEQNRRSQHS
jgi:ring-1,2-phenylacetyl-CoA epoxidase subunit PaaB